MSKGEGDSVQVSVRVPADQVGALERIAAEADRTVSAEIRRLIRRHVTEAMEPKRLKEAT
jgi:predicted DNA-binding protein